MCYLGRFMLLYGSQTGQSQAIAEQIRDRSLERGLSPDLHCLDQAGKKVSDNFGLGYEPKAFSGIILFLQGLLKDSFQFAKIHPINS